MPAAAFLRDQDDNPATYESALTDFIPDKDGRLLFRKEGDYSVAHDVPLFELPRAPLLSVGALQHFRIWNSRPFMVGNPWGTSATLNGIPLGQLFDRFWFSGLGTGVTPTTATRGYLLLPNPLLASLRKSDGTWPTLADIRPPADDTTDTTTDDSTTDGTTTDGSTSGTDTTGTTDETSTEDDTNTEPVATDYVVATRSSKHLLQAGAFNLNSTSVAAWTAVLRGIRFPSPQEFRYLNISDSTATAADTEVSSVQSTDAQFFRFSQTAQETYWTSSANTEGVTPSNTHLFRQGMRTLKGAQVAALATKIVELIAVKHAAADPAGGPFRSVEEFVAPNALFALPSTTDADGTVTTYPSRSLLEAAIADAGINAEIAEFSAQWLTPADLMTALAPILYPRSDTFLIRAYGEVVNNATNAVEGRAWCEAIVQRLPEYVDNSLPPETLPAAFEPVPNPDDASADPTQTTAQKINQALGRRFKIVSFRWLTRADI